MLNIRHLYQKNKGFTIIEYVIVIAISSIIIAAMFSMLNYSIKVATLVENEDFILLNGRFGLEYIKEEIRNSELIISSSKIVNLDYLYPNNIGFVLMNDSGVVGSIERYRFFTYYLNGNKLIRISRNKDKSVYPTANTLLGHNEVCEGILTLEDTNIDISEKLINLRLTVGIENKEVYCFKSTFIVNSNLDF